MIKKYLQFLNESYGKGTHLAYEIYSKCNDRRLKCIELTMRKNPIEASIKCTQLAITCLEQNKSKCDKGFFGKRDQKVSNECRKRIEESIKHYKSIIEFIKNKRDEMKKKK